MVVDWLWQECGWMAFLKVRAGNTIGLVERLAPEQD